MRPQNKIKNRELLIFLFFILVAVMAWFINKLSKEYPYQLSYTVCVYSSVEVIQKNCATNLLRTRVKATGFYIMKHLGKPSQLNIDIKQTKFLRTAPPYEEEEYIPTGSIQNAIIEAISSEGIAVEHIITESLLFNID